MDLPATQVNPGEIRDFVDNLTALLITHPIFDKSLAAPMVWGVGENGIPFPGKGRLGSHGQPSVVCRAIAFQEVPASHRRRRQKAAFLPA